MSTQAVDSGVEGREGEKRKKESPNGKFLQRAHVICQEMRSMEFYRTDVIRHSSSTFVAAKTLLQCLSFREDLGLFVHLHSFFPQPASPLLSFFSRKKTPPRIFRDHQYGRIITCC